MDQGLHFAKHLNSFVHKFVLAATLAVAGLALFTATQATAAVTFAPPATYTAGSAPAGTAIADLDGDGNLDLVVSNINSSNVSVRLGNGDGTFGPLSNFSVGVNPERVVIGDLNGDSKPDIVATSTQSDSITILFGNGDGTFGGAATTNLGPTAQYPAFVAIGDLNRDGNSDLAVSNVDTDNVTVLMGAGDGSFYSKTDFSVGDAPWSVAIGDLNGDSYPDLATANLSSNTVSILRNDSGSGAFYPMPDLAASSPFSVVIDDLDGNGRNDLAVSSLFSGNVSVHLDSSFATGTTFPVGGGYGTQVAIGDLDGDGIEDLAVSNGASSTPQVSVLLGTGTGTFGSPTNFSVTGNTPYSVVIGDLNGDGRSDLATANLDGNNVSVLLNTTDNTPPDTFIDAATPASPANTGVRTFTFHGVDPAPASPPITFECRIDGGAWFGCSSGYATPNLADGNHTFEVRAKDGAGNVDASPDSSSWVVDKTPPNTFIDTATPASPTNVQVRNFTYHGVDPAPGTAITLECRLDGGAWFTAGCNGTYTTATLPEGNHTFQVRAIDAAGNVDPTPATSTWMIDLTDPTINIVSPGVRERFVMGSGSKNYSCADPLSGGPPPVASGVDTCTDHGFSTAHLGNFRFQVDAADHAGNTSTDARAYAVDPPRYADLVNPHHPIAYYRLGDPLGSDSMADSSGNNRNGEFKNGIALRRPPAPSCHVRPHAPYTCDLTSDPQDWSAYFPARDGYGFTNNINAPQAAYTIEGWINRADTGAGSIMGQGGGGQLFVNSDGRLALRQTQDTVTSGGPVLTPGQWWHVAATWNGSVVRLYVNGNQVGFSNSANKPPSGSATLYVGYGDQAPWFHGSLDEMAYYGSALPGSAFAARYEVGTAHDVRSPVPNGPPIQRPSANMTSPNNGGLYAQGKLPPLDFYCEDLDGNSTVASCTATVDGNPVANGAALPDTPGSHPVVVTAVDDDGLTRSHTHTYTIKSFPDIYNTDSPVAYYRLGDATGDPMRDSGPQGRHGIYKNYQESGPVGISGDGDHARKFFGEGGYGYAQNIQAPKFQSTLEAWVNPDDLSDASIAGHGDAGEIYIRGGLFVFRHMGTEVTSHIGPVPGVFTQVAGVWDGVTLSIYVNGELQGQVEATKRPSSSSTFYVGYGEIRPWFKGSIDEVAYYDKALTPNRVLEHFLADPPPDGDDSVVDAAGEPPEKERPSKPGSDKPTHPGSDEPSSDPDDGNDTTAESGTGGKKSKAGKRKRAIKKCKKISKKSKRKACIKRAKKKF